MKRKGWLIPILVFLLSFYLLSFYQQKEQNSVSLATASELPPILWTLAPTDIHKLVYSVGESQIEVVREDNTWILPNLSNQRADDLYVYTVIGDFSQPLFERVIDVSPKDLTSYGIYETSSSLSLFDSLNNEYTLILGSEIDETMDYVYAPLVDTIYAINGTIFDGLKPLEADWRSRQLLDFVASDVANIAFTYKSLSATLVPSIDEGGNIVFTSPNINDELAAEFVHFLQSSKIQQFITDNAPSHVLDVYGFNSPSLTCTITLKSGVTRSLLIGNISKSENICYATLNGSNNIVAIPYFDLSQLNARYAEMHGISEDSLG